MNLRDREEAFRIFLSIMAERLVRLAPEPTLDVQASTDNLARVVRIAERMQYIFYSVITGMGTPSLKDLGLETDGQNVEEEK